MKKNKNFPTIAPGEMKDLRGKHVVIVGGTGGIGRALSRHFAANQAKVQVIGQTFRDQNQPGIEFLKADLSLISESRRAAGLIDAGNTDMLIFTTGIFAAPKRQETAEGLERDMAVSFLSRLVILREIAERLGQHRPHKARVFIMGYPGSGKPGTLDDLNAVKEYRAMDVHMNTVAGNEMLVLDAAARYSSISVFGLNPGIVKTNIRSNFLGGNKLMFTVLETLVGWFTPDADSYAKKIAPILLAQQLDHHSGTLFNRHGEAIMPSKGVSESQHMQAFLTQSLELVNKAAGRL